ncbi:trimethylamine methyltransferase family protein [Haloarculaceae archaeon H-GB1-1]|nr:trimethylamine methyltransferase family protein [Haloarculaceae archaeon H-GB1-1]
MHTTYDWKDPLTPEGVERLHERSLEILRDLGIRVDHEDALALLEEHGCDVDRETKIVSFPPDLVERCVERAPERFTLHARNPDNDVAVGGDDYVMTPVYGPPNIRTYESGRRPSTIDDYERMMKLVQREDPITCTGYNACEPNDVDQEVKHVEMIRRSLTLTDHPVMGSTYGEERAATSLDMVAIAVDDADLSVPYAAGLVNSVPPRQWDTKMVGGLMEYARRGQPVLISPGVMAAASGPATLAGTLALVNAENLSGIVIGQLVNPGAPVVYGALGTQVDVRHGSLAIGSPERSMCTSAGAQMARNYGLPSRGGGSQTDAKALNEQSGSESAFTLQTTLDSGINFVVHAAGDMESHSTASPEKFVLDCERIRHAERTRDGFELTEETFALDLIESVESGDHFLSERHTLEHSKSEHYFTDLFDRQSYDDWQNDGAKDPREKAHERVQAHLEAYERPPMDAGLERDLERFADERTEEILGLA